MQEDGRDDESTEDGTCGTSDQVAQRGRTDDRVVVCTDLRCLNDQLSVDSPMENVHYESIE